MIEVVVVLTFKRDYVKHSSTIARYHLCIISSNKLVSLKL